MTKSNLFLDIFPDILDYWNYNKNQNIDVKKLTKYSRISAYFFCRYCQNEFSKEVQNYGKGYCSIKCSTTVSWKKNKKRGILLKVKSPELLHFFSEKNKENFDTLNSGSPKKYWWICKLCRKNFERSIHGMNNKNSARVCQECRYKSVANTHKGNSLKKYGSLTKLDSKALSLFDNESNTKLPSEYPINSNEKIFLKCKFGHKTTRIVRLFFENPVCVSCARQTSKLELRIFCEFHNYFEDAIWQHKISTVEFAIFIPSISFAIEVDGSFWHSNKTRKDIIKNQFALDNNIELVRYRAGNIKKLEKSFLTNQKSESEEAFAEFCKFLISSNVNIKVMKFAKNWLRKPCFKATKYYQDLLSRLPSPPIGQSFGEKHPNLSKEWSKKNHPLEPFDIKEFSGSKHYWKCIKSEKHPDFLSTTAHRIEGKGCPACAGRILSQDNNLKCVKPLIAKRWNYKKNFPLTPEQILAGTTKSFWWICKNGHEWKDSPAWIKNDERSRPCVECNSVGFLFPELLEEWHKVKNNVSAFKINAYSNKKAWWTCKQCGDDFQMLISNRTHKTKPQSCPKHRSEKVWQTRASNLKKEQSFLYKKPVPAKSWDYKKNTLSPDIVFPDSNKRFYFICNCGASTTRILGHLKPNRKIDCICKR